LYTHFAHTHTQVAGAVEQGFKCWC